ncbi:glycine--tRNA ligase [Poriferisphaera sp. WC338]|uniref:glycine--tRNA ligase n=1 Tax=Poriferisphaera sp. WC338 TaxID=3425129 RepID=UPI003D815C17
MSDTSTLAPEQKSMEELVSLCKRRGFVYPASEIYGGINGFWDYGPLGIALKNNIRDHWWKHMVDCPPIGPDGEPVSIVGLDSSIIQNPKTWEASGHVGGFSDPMVDCTESKKRYRADHVLCATAKAEKNGEVRELGFLAVLDGDQAPADFEKRASKLCKKTGGGEVLPVTHDDFAEFHTLPREQQLLVLGPDATQPGTLTEPREFNLMFETYVGAIRDDSAKAYLRPETAQGIFLNYKNVLDTMRVKMPFGIAQIGKSFRNEVTPRNFIFRSREFEQMEMEWFCSPEDSLKWYEFWKNERMKWWESLGINTDNLIFRDHDDDELAHYSNACVDVEYKYPFTAPGYGELEGVAHRGCFDLTQHQTHAKTKLEYFDQDLQVKLQKEGVDKDEIKKRTRYVPNVIEPASGLTRAVLVLLCEAFTPDESRPSKVYMKFKPKFAPIKAGIFPLVNKDGMPEIAQKLYMQLREKFTCQYDVKQSIGKRYARMDEAGTPYCFTIDGDTLNDNTVTVRDRDSQEQTRIPIDQVESFLAEKLSD